MINRSFSYCMEKHLNPTTITKQSSWHLILPCVQETFSDVTMTLKELKASKPLQTPLSLKCTVNITHS